MLLVGNGSLITLGTQCRVIENGGVLIEGDKITRVGKSAELQAAFPGVEFIDCRGKLIMPGFTCAHTHTYGTFARGISLKDEAPENFPQVLERLWWRLDRALTLEDVYCSALVTFIGCIKNGTTSLLDHHSSPGVVDGSLEEISRAATRAGVRANLCYEISDRDGPKIMEAGLEENAALIKKTRREHSPLLTATMGMHASFTISEASMEKCARTAHDLETGVHIHVAESREDADDCLKKYGIGIVERLNKYGLLGPKTVAAHCIHISEPEMELLAHSGTAVAHNPQSNMNNAVGCAPVKKMLDCGVVLGMGTDGMTTDMIEGLKTAHILHKHCRQDPRMGWEEVPRMQFVNNPRIMASFFPCLVGEITPGAAADLVVADYNPPTPLTAENYYAHLVFGLSGGAIETTIVAGRVLMHQRKLTAIDENEVNSIARELSAKLWERF